MDKLSILKTMMRIRQVEEEIAKRYGENKMRCPTHLSIGQEATPTAVSQYLDFKDFVVSTHRGHAHYLAKGGNLKKMISEIYGKETGCSGGKGGSMHLIDVEKGFMGTSAIVGNSIPIGVGLGFSQLLKKSNNISCIYLGDGAVEEGVFYESVNFAVLKKLPVLFVCENNLYSVYSPLYVRQPKGRRIFKMVSEMGISSIGNLDGNDALKCCEVLNDVITKIRKGEGPFFVEFMTYRWREHCGPNFDNDIGYRSEEEYQYWKLKDPIEKLKKQILLEDANLKEKIIRFKNNINQEIISAFEYAENSKYPNQDEAYKGVYSSG